MPHWLDHSLAHYRDGVDDTELMTQALAQAQLALEHDDVPVGAVVVVDGQVVAAAHNERELRGDPTAHAEVLALRAAAQAVGNTTTVNNNQQTTTVNNSPTLTFNGATGLDERQVGVEVRQAMASAGPVR